ASALAAAASASFSVSPANSSVSEFNFFASSDSLLNHLTIPTVAAVRSPTPATTHPIGPIMTLSAVPSTFTAAALASRAVVAFPITPVVANTATFNAANHATISGMNPTNNSIGTAIAATAAVFTSNTVIVVLVPSDKLLNQSAAFCSQPTTVLITVNRAVPRDIKISSNAEPKFSNAPCRLSFIVSRISLSAPSDSDIPDFNSSYSSVNPFSIALNVFPWFSPAIIV